MIRGRERKKEQSTKTRRVSSKVAHSNPSPIALCIVLVLVRVINDVNFKIGIVALVGASLCLMLLAYRIDYIEKQEDVKQVRCTTH